MDRLSNLPDLAIERILEGLPLQDRVRTSVLSTAWKLRWTKLPSLIFDRETYLYFRKRKYRQFAPADYLNYINSLAERYITPVQKLYLYLPTISSPNNISAFVNTIESLLKMGVQSLHLVNLGSSQFPVPPSMVSSTSKLTDLKLTFCEFAPLTSSSMFSSSKLTHLELKKCKFDPLPSFEGFPNLVSLKWVGPESTPDAVSCLISSCPLLQTITLDILQFKGQPLYLDVPKLVHLFVKGSFKRIYIQNSPYLEKLIVRQDTKEGVVPTTSLISNFFENMSKLRQLDFEGHFCQMLLAHCTAGLHQLTILNIYNFALINAEDVSFIFSLAESCPNLKELSITMEYVMMRDQDARSEIKKFSHCTFQHLVRIHLGVTGENAEMTLIEALLGCSPVLHLMSLRLIPGYADRKLRVLEKVITYSRASTKAKVVYTKKDHVCSL